MVLLLKGSITCVRLMHPRVFLRAVIPSNMIWVVQYADVYAFGVLLVEMYAGERSFSGMRQPQIIHNIAVLKEHPRLPSEAPAFLQVKASQLTISISFLKAFLA